MDVRGLGVTGQNIPPAEVYLDIIA